MYHGEGKLIRRAGQSGRLVPRGVSKNSANPKKIENPGVPAPSLTRLQSLALTDILELGLEPRSPGFQF